LQKTKLTTTIVITVLLLSIITPLIQFTNANDNTSTKPNYTDTALVQHKMSAGELQAYKDSAGTYQQGQNYNKIVAGYGTGLHPPTEEGWVEIAENAYVVEKIAYQTTLPAAVDHTTDPWFPPIGDQGQQGSCASFAVGYYCKTYQEAKEHSWDLTGATWTGGAADGNISAGYQGMVMSPAFVYDLINGGRDVGSDFETPIRLVSNVGICSWMNMPYYYQNCTRWPTEAAWNEAPLYRSNSTYGYQYLYVNTTQGVESLKNWLAAGNLAIIGIGAYDNLLDLPSRSDQDLLIKDKYVFGGLDHAATIVGYDDLFTYMEDGSVHHGAFKIVNSWGKGDWETIPDGCYWITYGTIEKLSNQENPAMLFQNLADYQPEILATFNTTHAARGDCNITFGLGTPEAPIVTKNFTDFINGGNRSFCPNNIVFDLTEFKTHLTSQYNQPFFMQVYDKGIDSNGNAATGTINYFAVANTPSTQTPIATGNDRYVNLTLTHSFAPLTFEVSPLSGPAGGEIVLEGVGFESNTVDISYYDPIVGQWVPILSGYPVSTNFTYATHAPDLKQCSAIGDNPPIYDNIVYRVQDNGNWYNSSCNVWRKGLVQVDNQTANGVFGNSTDLSTKVFVQNGQTLLVAGKWFNPGLITIAWDDQNFGSTTADSTGFFNASITVPTTTAGKHSLTFFDRNSNLSTTITRLPTVSTNYTDAWYTEDFSVNIAADYPVSECYYRVNNGQICTVSADGQPRFATEASDNKLEYWSTWNIYGTGNMELNHTTITGIKLDKTAPTAWMQINGGSITTSSSTVRLALSAADSGSDIKQVRFSNDGTWNQAVWEQFTDGKTWQLTSGSGAKTVYCQIQDNAGLTSTVSASIVVSAPQATATPSPTATPAPTVPEYSMALFILLLAILTASMIITLKTQGKQKTKS
jgi:hypothetical protein